MAVLEGYSIYGAALAVLAIFVVKAWVTRPKNLPPGPLGLPIIGVLHVFGGYPHQALADLAKQYGPLMSLRLGRKLCIIASSADVAMDILKNQDANFSSRPAIQAAQIVTPNDFGWVDFTPITRQLRKVFQVELAGQKQLSTFQHIREGEISGMLSAIPQGKPVVLEDHLRITTTNVISRLTLNKAILPRGEVSIADEMESIKFRDTIKLISKCQNTFNPVDFGLSAFKWLGFQGLEKRFRDVKKQMDSVDEPVIAEHRELRKKGPVPAEEKDFLHLVLDLKETNKDITEDDVKNIFWAAFSAGTETSISTLEWAMAELMNSPHVMKKAQAEIDAVVGKDRRVAESDLPELKYIQAIVKETLRLHPPAPLLLPRQSLEACNILGYDIPAKTRLFVNVWTIGRDEKLWVEPLKFNPERWLEERTPEGNLLRQQLELLSFGGGRRLCPGMLLGIRTTQSNLSNLLHVFNWSPVSPNDPSFKDMSERPGSAVLLPKRISLKAIPTARLPARFYPKEA